jgi:hypothetical protein
MKETEAPAVTGVGIFIPFVIALTWEISRQKGSISKKRTGRNNLKMKNIIFLDFDGVLNCMDFYETKEDFRPYPLSEFCPDRIELLNKLCKDTNAVVVLSTSWRVKGFTECKNILSQLGATFEIIGATPSLTLDLNYPEEPYMSVPRGVEIRYWLSASEYAYSKYAILDDDKDMLMEQKDNFFVCELKDGLTPEICERIKLFFTKK